jgi:hypothetical protein
MGLTPPPATQPPPSSVLGLSSRIVACPQEGLARAEAMDDIDGVPAHADQGSPQPRAPAPPTMLWDRILARRLAL